MGVPSTYTTYILIINNETIKLLAAHGYRIWMWFLDVVFAILFRRRYSSRNLYSLTLPPIDASNATPTPHIPLLAFMATSPAQCVP